MKEFENSVPRTFASVVNVVFAHEVEWAACNHALKLCPCQSDENDQSVKSMLTNHSEAQLTSMALAETLDTLPMAHALIGTDLLVSQLACRPVIPIQHAAACTLGVFCLTPPLRTIQCVILDIALRFKIASKQEL